MKNILEEKPTPELNNRMAFSMNFVEDNDLKNKTVLDIGCGFGWCELNFLDREVKKICGIEITKADLQAAKDNIKNKSAEFKIGSALEIPYPDNSFDAIVSWEVIEHIPKNTELKMFQEVARVLKPNGVFYLSTPYDHPIAKYLDPAWWLIGHRHYSIKQLKFFAKSTKMITDKITRKGKIWSSISLLNMYISKWIFRSKPLSHSFFLNQEKNEYHTEGYVNIFVRYIKK